MKLSREVLTAKNLSSKTTKDIGDMVSGNHRRKSMVTDEEAAHLMAVREVYRAVTSGNTVCVILPQGKSVEEVFDNYYKIVKSKIKCGLAKFTTMDALSVEDLDMSCVVDFNGVI